MKRFLKIAIPVFLLGFIAGNAFWYLASPLWIDRVISEELPAELMLSELAAGQFRDTDAAHKGRGKAQLLSSAGGTVLLRLTDFEVTNGPDLEMWLVEAAEPATSADVKASKWVSLGPLKGNIGEQNYIVPQDANLAGFKSVVIWCEQFGVLFAAADLTATAS